MSRFEPRGFTFGAMDFYEMFPTSEAIHHEWEALSGLSIESLEVPGQERRRFLQTDRPMHRVWWTIILHGDTVAEVEEARDRFMMHVDPALGPQRMVDDDYPEWYQEMTVSEEIIWDRLTWGCHVGGYRYRGEVLFESYGDSAWRLRNPDAVEVEGTAEISLEGTTRSWPRWEFSERLSANQAVKFTVSPVLGASWHEVTVKGPLASGQTMVLNYDTMEFAVWQGTRKVASLVNRMSTLERPELHPMLGEVQVNATVRRQVEYEWAGTPHASESIKRVDGVEVARNRVVGGSFEDAGLPGWGSSGSTLSRTGNYGGQMFAPRYGGEGPEGGRYGEYIAECVANQADRVDFYMIQPWTSYLNVSPGEWVGISGLIAHDRGSLGDLVIQFRNSTGSTVGGFSDYQVAGFYGGRKVHRAVQAPPETVTARLVIWVRTADGAKNVEGTRLWAEGVIGVVAKTKEHALIHSADYWDGDTPGGYQAENATATFYPNSRRQ